MRCGVFALLLVVGFGCCCGVTVMFVVCGFVVWVLLTVFEFALWWDL